LLLLNLSLVDLLGLLLLSLVDLPLLDLLALLILLWRVVPAAAGASARAAGSQWSSDSSGRP